MKRVTSTDIKNWAPQRDCQENLPLLVRKLIRTENVKITDILFPAGDNIVLSGWDGILRSEESTIYIPEGFSVWEIGCRKDFFQKIKEDYKKRTENPKSEILGETTYVAVTPYVWSEKDEWVKEEKAKCLWKDIRVIDGLVLEEWIETSPVVGAWLSKYLGKSPDIKPLDDFWDEWSNSSKHKISPTLVLSGRELATESLLTLLKEPPSSIIIKSSTVQESIAFVAASIYKNDAISQEQILARTAIVENENDFKNIIPQRNPLILIVRFEDSGIIERAIRNGHHVIIPVGFDTTSTQTDNINLPRIRRKGFEDGLKEMGFNREEAENLTRDSGQSLSVLRRLLQFVKNQQPEWAKENNHIDLIPAVLMGSWDEGVDGDKDMIAELAGINYDQYITKLSRWKLHKDAPVIQVGTIWRLTSSLDAWSILAPFLLKKDFEKFKAITCKVLTEINPSLELAPDVRYMASMYGKKTIFSYSLKEGVCKSLVLAAVFGDTYSTTVIGTTQNFIDSIVYEILYRADGKRWCSLNHYLPLLSEASPGVFLREVNAALIKDKSEILEIFQETRSILAPNSYHTGLLWGLESLAISPSYLMQVTLILGKLARLDPGGQLANRPINSLREIFIPWYIQTEATPEMRKAILKKLATEEPEIAWSLFLSLLPNNHNTVSPIYRCHWRFNEQNIEPTTTRQEVASFYSFLVDQVIQLANSNAKRIESLIKYLDDINSKDRSRMLEMFKNSKEELNDDTYEIWNSLRKLIIRHQTHADMDWALPADELNKLREVLVLYEPADEVSKIIYLFEDAWVELPEGPKRKEMSHEKREEFVGRIRSSALSAVYRKLGIEALLSVADKTVRSWIVGNATAKVSLEENDEHFIVSILQENNATKARFDFASDFVRGKAQIASEAWVENIWMQLVCDFKDSNSKTNFFLALPQNNHTWQLLETIDQETMQNYWKKMNPWFYRSNADERKYAFAQLHKANRHISVLDNAAHFIDEFSAEALADILYNVATIPSDESVRLDDYDVTLMFKALKEKGGIDKTKQIQLEWLYLPFLADAYSEYKPFNLLNELSDNPAFFVEVVSFVFLPDNPKLKEEILTEEQKKAKYKRTESAYKLLDCWQKVPGINDNNIIDKDYLTSWIANAREIATKKNCLIGVDLQLGKILASCPRNNEFWPCETICEVIDSLNSQRILDEFETAVFNSRGTYSKAAYEGGDQERALAAYFEKMATQILPRWPLTASALQKLTKNYINDAKREDESARMDELR